MKKRICFVLLMITLLVSTVIAENNFTEYGNWVVKSYVDEFDIPTGVYYCTSYTSGKFNNSAVTGADLRARVLVQRSSSDSSLLVGLTLFEYGNRKVINNSTKYNKSYNMIMMDSNGEKYYIDAVQPPQSEYILTNDSKDDQLILDAFTKGGSVRFHLEDAERTSSTYTFTFNDTTDFDKALDALDAK